MKETLTAEQVREVLRYDPITGAFNFRADRSSKVKAWDYAGSIHPTIGYIYISISRRKYLAHRLAWLYMTGEWPKAQIDHINGLRGDNSFSNLRDVPNEINGQNRRRAPSNSKTGMLGVLVLDDQPRNKRFAARITLRGKSVHLGVYATAEEAHAAYLKAKRELHEGCTI